VKFRGGPRGTAARSSASKFGHKVKQDFDHIGWQHIKLPADLSVDDALKLYMQEQDVLAAEPNCIATNVCGSIPNDPMFPLQWGLAITHTPKAWDITTGNSNVVVAILDSGINYLHEDLAANMWHNSGEIPGNGIDDDGNGYVDDEFGANMVDWNGNPMDMGVGVYHGTGIAGIIGGVANNGVGGAGMNWEIQLMGVRVLNTGDWMPLSSVIAGQNYVLAMRQRGVNVRAVNISYGQGPVNNGWGYSQAEKDGIDALGAAGVIVVAIAHNFTEDIETTPLYPASYDSPNIITVAASTPSDRLADFTSWGRVHVDLAAPGAVTTNIVLVSGPGPNAYTFYWGGTSAAAPHVAGAVALLAAAYPNATVAELKAAILDTVDVIGPFQGMMVTGGRLNVARALLHLRTNQPPVMVAQPQSISAFRGGNASLAASAGGTPPLAYQWFRGSNLVAGATNALLTLTNLGASQTGLWVLVSNAYGTATSFLAQLVVHPRSPSIVAWGAKPHGQCDVPQGLVNVVAIAGGRWHGLGLCSDGTVIGWGSDQRGTSVPASLGKAMAIAAGTMFSVALLTNGTVEVWGATGFGQGNIPVGLNDAVAIAGGQIHCLALKSNGKVVAWGWNTAGQCNVPGDLTDAIAVSGGFDHSLAVLRNGTVRAWGDNAYGQCSVPGGLADVSSVVAGAYSSLALKRDGSLVAWGSNPNGELNIPAGLSNVVAITGYAHFMALKRDGTAVAWGAGLTDQKTDLQWGQAIVPPGLTNVIAISSNGRHSLALLAPQLAPPVLAVTSQAGVVILSWPTHAAAWQLVSATTLTGPLAWQPWAGPQTTNAGLISASVAATNGSHFFRLRSP